MEDTKALFGIRYRVFAPNYTTDFYSYNGDGSYTNMQLDKTARNRAKLFSTAQEAHELMWTLRDTLPSLFPSSFRIEIQMCRRPSWHRVHQIACIR